MIHALLSDLVDRKITTVKEISDLTEHGPSTVYRWLKGETQPDIADVVKLIRHLSRPEGRRMIVEMFTTGMPVRLEWLAADNDFNGDNQPPEDVLDLAMLTMECLSKVMLNQRETFRTGQVTEKLKLDLDQLLSSAINYLSLAQRVVEQTPVTRRRARPLPPASP